MATELWWHDQANRIASLELQCRELSQRLAWLSEIVDIHRDKIHDLESRDAE